MELNPAEKFSLFEKIMEKKFAPQKSSIFSRILYAKTFRYSIATLFIIAWAYGANIFRNDIAFFAGSLMIEDSNIAQAWYIAKIIDFQWAFYIEHNGKNIVSTAINAGDTVTLKKGTKITFNIDEKTQGTIVWPAQFEMQEEKNTNLKQSVYKLNMIRGDFVEISSINKTTEQNIDINIEDMTVRQRIGQTASHYTISKKGETRIVNNQGASLLVATTDDQKTVASRQILAVADNDITLVEDGKIIASAINKGDISQTINIGNKGETRPSVQDDELIALLADVSNDPNTTTPNTIAMSTTRIANTQSDKLVPTPEQNTQLQSILSSKSLTDDMQDIFTNQGSLQLITNKIKSIAKAFDIKVQVSDSLGSIATASTELATQIEAKYFVSPNSINNLKAIASWAIYIQKEGGVFDSIDSANSAWKDLKNNLPSNLRFQ